MILSLDVTVFSISPFIMKEERRLLTQQQFEHIPQCFVTEMLRSWANFMARGIPGKDREEWKDKEMRRRSWHFVLQPRADGKKTKRLSCAKIYHIRCRFFFLLELFRRQFLVLCMCAYTLLLSLCASVGRLICDGMRRHYWGGRMVVSLLCVSFFMLLKYHKKV